MNIERSKRLYAEAAELMPGGVNSPVRAFNAVGGNPLFISRAKGSKIYDADGNSFIDYVCSWGPGILGHARPEVVEAAKEACESGLSFGAPTERESRLVSLIMKAMPSIQMARLVSSGTEAAMSAVRAARGYTGRDKVIKFEGCYHGHSDGMLVKAGSGLLSNSRPDSGGVPEACARDTLIASYNDRQSVERLFEDCGGAIAAVIVEPVAANMGVIPPADGFLQFLREITLKYGAALIFDEVITGFRLGLGGAQGYYGVEPDITVLGKIVGGGMPLAAYGGRRDIMEKISPLGSVYQAGTLSGNPVATAAGIKTLELLFEDTDIYSRLDKKAQTLEKAFKARGLTVNRVGSLLSVFFTDKPAVDYASAKSSDTKAFAGYFRHMLEMGVYTAPSQFEAMFVSAAHTAQDIEETINAINSYNF